jgi:hypothetical protein
MLLTSPYILLTILQWEMYIQALAQMKSINLLGVQQICRNSIALEQVQLSNVVEIYYLICIWVYLFILSAI